MFIFSVHVCILVLLACYSICIHSECENFNKIIEVIDEFQPYSRQLCFKNATSKIIFYSSLTDALEEENLSNTCVILKGRYATLTRYKLLQNITNFKITSIRAEILCLSNSNNNSTVGLHFQFASDILLSHVKFKNCGSTLKLNEDENDEKIIHAGISFKFSNNVTLQHLLITNSFGYGLVLLDCRKINIDHTKLTLNQHIHSVQKFNYNSNYTFGGGLYIQFSRRLQNKNIVLISNCQFIANSATAKCNDKKHQCGKGAGLTVFILQNSSGNALTIINSDILNNSAEYGGGAYVHLSRYSSNNSLTFKNVQFVGNSANEVGGGLLINVSNNDNYMTLYQCSFLGNEAIIGGGLAVIKSTAFRLSSYSFPKINIECLFKQNYASLGACLLIKNIFVKFNNLTVQYCNVRKSKQLGQGTFYAFHSILQFTGVNLIQYNYNTALVLYRTELHIYNSLHFIGNFGNNGGAIALYGHSKIKITDSTDLMFINNTAINKGGAIYVSTPDLFVLRSLYKLNIYDCFISFFNTTVYLFSGRVEFLGNNVTCLHCGIDIFATSIKSCQHTNERLSEVITHWKNFIFHTKSASITTNAVTISVKQFKWNPYPGQIFTIDVTLLDEKENYITDTVDIKIENGHLNDSDVSIETDPVFVVSSKNPIRLTLLGEPNKSTFNVKVQTESGAALTDKLYNKTLRDCPFGFYWNKNVRKCECDVIKNQKNGIAQCYRNKIFLVKNRWVNPDETTSYVCPFDYCGKCSSQYGGRYCLYRRTHQCTENRNQTSRLCSKCKKNYSVSMGGEICRKCNRTLNYIWVTVGIIIVTSALIIIFVTLNLDIFSYNINSFLYSYQIIDLLYTSDQPLDSFLDFFIRVFHTSKNLALPIDCLWDGMNNLQKMAYSYAIPGYMIAFMTLLFFLSKYYPCKRFTKERCFNAFTIVIVMTFSDFTRISFDLLNPIEIDGVRYLHIYAEEEYFGELHIKFGISALIIIVIFVIIIPSVFIYYSVTAPTDEMSPTFYRRNFLECLKEKRYYRYMILPYSLFCRLLVYAVGTFLLTEPLKLSLLALFCFCICITSTAVSAYKEYWMNIIETINLTNLLFICIFSLGVVFIYNEVEKTVYQVIIRVLSYVPLCTGAFAVLISVKNR